MKAEDSRPVDAGEAESGRNPEGALPGAEGNATTRRRTKAELGGLMEAVCERGNLKLAYQRVVENKGAAGVDGITVKAFKTHLKQHWPTIRAKLLAGGLHALAGSPGGHRQVARRGEDTGHPRVEPDASGLDGLLPANRIPAGVGGTRWLDQAQTAVHSVAAVETLIYSRSQPDEGRTDRGPRVALGHQRPWPLVERRGQPHERGLPEVLLRSFGAGVAARYDATTPACSMNRRMRNRTSGGVGGRRG